MAIETHGWDLVYAMRFPAVNQDLQQRAAAEERAKTSLRKTVLALPKLEGLPTGLYLLRVTQAGQHWAAPPKRPAGTGSAG